ncbi:probable disease resistance protein At4g19060 [Eucalyptus grandis]|uniref:probable disease resistance protein At4g19060 n=1 Tax=Eucalyptus grandis TaxID=71139 RepID=UPI00192EE6AD|nr:probable disease resistance protein At4g19060 [Eucalyptus grandis]
MEHGKYSCPAFRLPFPATTKLHNGPRVRFYRRFTELESLLDKIKASESPARKSIKEELYCLNNVLEECQVLARKKRLSLPTILSPSKFQISRTLDKIKHQIDQSIANSQETCILPQNLEASRGSSTWVDLSRVRGFDSEVVNLETKLLRPGKPSDSSQAIAIIGTSGIGKTTLAQLVYNKQEVKAHFLPRIWVSLSPQPNEAENTSEAIAKKLLTRLGVETDIISSIDSHGLRGLLYALHLQLLGKRYLIVLDDVRDTNPWHNVWDELPKGNGGSVVITSRTEKVANTMDGEDNVIRLQPLTNPESCWCIFRDEVEKDGEKLNDDEIRKLKPAVTKKSAGLPLAAKVTGEIFYEKRKAKEVGEHGEIHPQES